MYADVRADRQADRQSAGRAWALIRCGAIGFPMTLGSQLDRRTGQRSVCIGDLVELDLHVQQVSDHVRRENVVWRYSAGLVFTTG